VVNASSALYEEEQMKQEFGSSEIYPYREELLDQDGLDTMNNNEEAKSEIPMNA
jgi:hypothetical protein